MERIHATYWLETGDDPAHAAEVIAGEQSSGTFVALPTETPELKARAGARVERLQILDSSTVPSLPTPAAVAHTANGRYTRALLELSWPLANLGPCLPTLMATIAGNLTMLGSAANMIVAFQAAKVGDRTFTSERHAPFGIPSTILSLYAGTFLLSMVHFSPECSEKLGECDE